MSEKLNGKMKQEQVMPDAEESIKFWNEFQGNPVDHNRNAEWIMAVEKEFESFTQQIILASLKRMFPFIFGKYQIGKCQALMDYMDSGWKNTLLFTR